MNRVCCRMIGGGGLRPGVYCALDEGHDNEHAPPEPVARNTEHPSPFNRNHICLSCDRCGHPMWYPMKGYCEYCAHRVSIGVPMNEKRQQCACGRVYAD